MLFRSVTASKATRQTVAVSQSFLTTILAATVFTAIIGAGLYYLAFPENRTQIPIGPERFERGDTEPTAAGETDGDTPGHTDADADRE